MRGKFSARLRKVVAVMAVGALVAACGSDDEPTVTDTPSPTETETDAAGPPDEDPEAGPRSVTVEVDGSIEGSNVALLGYFPREVTVRQGDTVDFALQPGDPHSITFGALVDEAFAFFAAGDETAEPPAALQQIPQAFPEDGSPPDPAAVLPCFTADAPTLGEPCEEGQPDFDGSFAFYNSGLLEPTNTFSMTIADDAATGTYGFFCLLHGPDMSGSVTVVAADEDAPTPEEVTAQGSEQRDAVAAAAAPVLEAQPTGVHPGLDMIPQGDDQVLAGGFVPEPVPVDILQFGPAEVTVAAGESVTWNVVGFHTISFNATQDATPPIIPGEDGLPTFNPLAFAPQGGSAGAPPPPEGEGPPPDEPPGPPMVVDAGAWDGTGFFSSGLFPSLPPALLSYKVTFPTAGTYTYQCLIHPDMEGTVNVTG